MGIPLINAELLALFLETFAYAIFVLLDCVTIPILIWRRAEVARTSRILLPVAVLMLLIATAHIVIDFYRAYVAFTTGRLQPGDTSTTFYENLADPLFITKSALYWLQTTLGDSVIIWRCFIVFAKRWLVVVFPVLLMVPALALPSLEPPYFSPLHSGSQLISSSQCALTSTAQARFSSLSTTISSTDMHDLTGLIAWRIYNTGRFRPSAGNMMPIIVVLIESGALYTSSVIAMLCSYLSGSNGQYPALDLITPLVGIVFCLIILQIRYHFNMPSSASASSNYRSGSNRTEWGQHGDSGAPIYPLNPIAIEITTHREQAGSSMVIPQSSTKKDIEARSDSI
ncbi:hypothetical protein HETIRDRAFT_324812 [Heterobasidion irregulare TC 32-1]|uniref:Uncharacterized protein n=1 Tax=Heterobasidion irregulare (strain TC 32-1) TaxID=747525 RepID=W4JYQ1_HETIT|nr:uncharacterized protein HETIRDRAFT_324812 [Heterobasidion irregulare TC 32-1]ETW78678.1 hypothetical protein HETIRDRAFT_324812 [Heterobasidion irregulare TC 32-1]